MEIIIAGIAIFTATMQLASFTIQLAEYIKHEKQENKDD